MVVRARAGLDVALHVQREVVRPRETPVAMTTLERLGSRVLSVVTSQLVRARETPAAALPLAFVRLFTCNTNTTFCRQVQHIDTTDIGTITEIQRDREMVS